VVFSCVILVSLLLGGCGDEPLDERAHPGPARGDVATVGGEPSRSILLVTLDTTRADVVGFEGGPAETPALDRLALEGVRFEYAYATAPMTLPSHASMMSGLYPAGHGVHENGRSVDRSMSLAAPRLRDLGYETAAFVSGFPLARQFGLARGFDHFDDAFVTTAAERTADRTTDAALAFLNASSGDQPLFVWVHYFDAHDPFEAPASFAARHPSNPYAAEVAFVDSEMSRLVEAFRSRVGERYAVVVVGDHGEGLGDHGEERHGNLLYDGVMRVPLVVAGPGISSRVVEQPASVRRVFHTVLDLAGEPSSDSLLENLDEIVLAEAMKPYLHYGWQPQVMAVTRRKIDGGWSVEKVIRSGERAEIYSLGDDRAEATDLVESRRPSPEVLARLREYPLPQSGPRKSEGPLSSEDSAKLAALGYVASSEPPTLRASAPHAREMTALFESLDRGAGLFSRERWAEAIAVYSDLAERDPNNLVVRLRLAVSNSLAGDRESAEDAFRAASEISPESFDRLRYEALHHCRFGDLERAAGMLDEILDQVKENVPALECLAEARMAVGLFPDAVEYLVRVTELRPTAVGPRLALGEAQMALGRTEVAIESFEVAEGLDRSSVAGYRLELGVLYLAAGRFAEARSALDAITEDHPDYAMVLFKRAQVAALLREPDWADRVRRALDRSTPLTRGLIEQERLFEGVDRSR